MLFRMPSPFVFQQPLAPAQLRGREEEVRTLAEAAAAGNAITVSGPRRYGKTSVLLAVRERLQEDGHPVVLVDLYGTASLAELAVRLERGWAGVLPRWRKVANRVLEASQLGLSLGGQGIGVTFQRQPRTDPLPALHALLALPEKVAEEGRRVIVILDEFQSVGDLKGAEGLLRSHLQHQRDVAGYVFAGSETHLLDRQFDDPDRPFFGQALRLRLRRPGRGALAETIETEFVRTERDPGEALGPLLDLADEHPQRAMLLAHFLWGATPEGQIADLATWEAALAATRIHVAGEVEARYDRASRNQQRVLRAVAHHASPFAAAARAALGLEGGSVTKTVELAIRDGLLEQHLDPDGQPLPGRYRLIDPMLGDWIRRRFP
jgi:uncharacterized protein